MKSRNAAHRSTGYAIQALIDLDRRNPEGVEEALAAFVTSSDETEGAEDARQGLADLGQVLHDQRKIQGIRPPQKAGRQVSAPPMEGGRRAS